MQRKFFLEHIYAYWQILCSKSIYHNIDCIFRSYKCSEKGTDTISLRLKKAYLVYWHMNMVAQKIPGYMYEGIDIDKSQVLQLCNPPIDVPSVEGHFRHSYSLKRAGCGRRLVWRNQPRANESTEQRQTWPT